MSQGTRPLAVRSADRSEVIPVFTLDGGADTFIPFRVLRLPEPEGEIHHIALFVFLPAVIPALKKKVPHMAWVSSHNVSDEVSRMTEHTRLGFVHEQN